MEIKVIEFVFIKKSKWEFKFKRSMVCIRTVFKFAS